MAKHPVCPTYTKWGSMYPAEGKGAAMRNPVAATITTGVLLAGCATPDAKGDHPLDSPDHRVYNSLKGHKG